MVADIKVPVQLGPSFLLQLPRFPCLVRAYPSFLSFPKPSTITIPIIVAADGRFPHRYAPGTQVQLKAEMSSEAVDGYILLFAEEIEETDEPSTIQELFIFGKVISKGGRVAGHFSIDAITAQPDSLIISIPFSALYHIDVAAVRAGDFATVRGAFFDMNTDAISGKQVPSVIPTHSYTFWHDFTSSFTREAPRGFPSSTLPEDPRERKHIRRRSFTGFMPIHKPVAWDDSEWGSDSAPPTPDYDVVPLRCISAPPSPSSGHIRLPSLSSLDDGDSGSVAMDSASEGTDVRARTPPSPLSDAFNHTISIEGASEHSHSIVATSIFDNSIKPIGSQDV